MGTEIHSLYLCLYYWAAMILLAYYYVYCSETLHWSDLSSVTKILYFMGFDWKGISMILTHYNRKDNVYQLEPQHEYLYLNLIDELWSVNIQEEIIMSYMSYNGISLYLRISLWKMLLSQIASQIAKFMWPTWGPPGSCLSQMCPMLAP